jgi:hypothetical protein
VKDDIAGNTMDGATPLAPCRSFACSSCSIHPILASLEGLLQWSSFRKCQQVVSSVNPLVWSSHRCNGLSQGRWQIEQIEVSEVRGSEGRYLSWFLLLKREASKGGQKVGLSSGSVTSRRMAWRWPSLMGKGQNSPRSGQPLLGCQAPR